MNDKNKIINETISNFHSECSKLSKDMLFTDAIKKHEEIIIKVILETIFNNKN